ncbi:hypothetical protein BC938DRAFT_471673 [Jimgerdemannia flammicorona]|uniref:Uncharacterized protein n=1 Tax=Jimgerdemannia flammicorona TaxID=994334 RepID=A0A433Q7M8_9FUNG|nr:hypothetical protein BC938DRAFT_471673 [Jimgerdemannia flammicorona]
MEKPKTLFSHDSNINGEKVVGESGEENLISLADDTAYTKAHVPEDKSFAMRLVETSAHSSPSTKPQHVISATRTASSAMTERRPQSQQRNLSSSELFGNNSRKTPSPMKGSGDVFVKSRSATQSPVSESPLMMGHRPPSRQHLRTSSSPHDLTFSGEESVSGSGDNLFRDLSPNNEVSNNDGILIMGTSINNPRGLPLHEELEDISSLAPLSSTNLSRTVSKPSVENWLANSALLSPPASRTPLVSSDIRSNEKDSSNHQDAETDDGGSDNSNPEIMTKPTCKPKLKPMAYVDETFKSLFGKDKKSKPTDHPTPSVKSTSSSRSIAASNLVQTRRNRTQYESSTSLRLDAYKRVTRTPSPSGSFCAETQDISEAHASCPTGQVMDQRTDERSDSVTISLRNLSAMVEVQNDDHTLEVHSDPVQNDQRPICNADVPPQQSSVDNLDALGEHEISLFTAGPPVEETSDFVEKPDEDTSARDVSSLELPSPQSNVGAARPNGQAAWWSFDDKKDHLNLERLVSSTMSVFETNAYDSSRRIVKSSDSFSTPEDVQSGNAGSQTPRLWASNVNNSYLHLQRRRLRECFGRTRQAVVSQAEIEILGSLQLHQEDAIKMPNTTLVATDVCTTTSQMIGNNNHDIMQLAVTSFDQMKIAFDNLDKENRQLKKEIREQRRESTTTAELVVRCLNDMFEERRDLLEQLQRLKDKMYGGGTDSGTIMKSPSTTFSTWSEPWRASAKW